MNEEIKNEVQDSVQANPATTETTAIVLAKPVTYTPLMMVPSPQDMPQEMSSYIHGMYDSQPLHLCTTMDLSKPKSKAIIANLQNSTDFTAEEMIDSTLRVVDFVLWQKPTADRKTGEYGVSTVYALILDDGSTVSGMSSVVKDCLVSLVRMFGPPPWADRGLPCQIKTTKKPGGNVFHRLVLIPADM